MGDVNLALTPLPISYGKFATGQTDVHNIWAGSGSVMLWMWVPNQMSMDWATISMLVSLAVGEVNTGGPQMTQVDVLPPLGIEF